MVTTAQGGLQVGRAGADKAAESYAEHPGILLTRTGKFLFRYGLALIFVWIGVLKFTSYEAKNIEPFLMSSPLWSWIYHAAGLQAVSNMIGIVEIAIGLMLASRPMWPRLSAAGSFGAVAVFLTTLSFLVTTPGVWEPGYSWPALSALPGQFLAKDLVLLGVSLWTAGEALQGAWVEQNARAQT